MSTGHPKVREREQESLIAGRIRFLNTRQAATYLGIPPNTLRWMRYMNVGPKFYKPRGRVLYDVADLDSFMDSGRRVTSSVRASKETTRNVAV